MLARRSLRTLVARALIVLAAPAAEAAAGDTVWTATWGGVASLRDTPRDVVVDAAHERVYVVGTTTVSDEIAGTITDIVTVAYDANTGTKLWARRYDGAVHGSDLGIAIVYDPSSGGVNVLGASETSFATGQLDTVTIAYAADGSRRWVRRIKNPAGNLPVDLVVDAGSTYIFVNGDHGRLVAYDFAGTRSWGHAVTPQTLAEGRDLIDVGGYLIVLGTVSDGSGGSAMLTSGFTTNGDAVWAKRFSGPATHAVASDAAVGANGTIAYVTGSYSDGTVTKITTIAYEPHNGFRFWRRSIPPQAANEIDGRPHVAVSDDGSSIVVSTASHLNGVHTFLTRRYLGDGSVDWTARENGPEDAGGANDVVISPSGNVYTVGQGTNSDGQQGAFLVAYDPLGPPSTFEAAVPPTDIDDVAISVATGNYADKVFVASRVGGDIRVDTYAQY
jgi:hypothetical protein